MARKQRNTQKVEIKTASYRAGWLLVKLLFGCVARIRVLGHENASRAGGFLLAANHISHFDPFLISLTVRRKTDWMTMAEFFRSPVLGFLLRAIDAFPAERDRAAAGRRAAPARRIDARADRWHSGFAVRDPGQRSPLLTKTVAAVSAHADLDRLRQSDFTFSRAAKNARARADRIRIGGRVQKSLRGITRKISAEG
ncbi:MAG: hypothetical protein DME90_11300 [Verrucomicrobia bacterium]|nr:MAG: hypothetical protein DME90_11300 [Verrucomicrobiota bacterium]